MQANTKERTSFLILLFAFFAIVFRFIPGFDYDFYCFYTWAINIKNDGLGMAYNKTDINYLPFYQYVLYIYGKIAGSEEDIIQSVRLLRLFTLAFEILGLWYVCKWVGKNASFVVLVFVSLLNLGFSFDTIVWGQVDGIFSAFIFIAFYYAYKQNMLWSSIWLVLAINAKLQGVIFLPLWFLMCLNNLVIKKNIRAFLLPLVTVVATQILILIPFLLQPGQLQKIWGVITISSKYYPKLSVAAFNLWCLVMPPDKAFATPDTGMLIAGISYKHAGLILFCIFSAAAMLPVVRDVYSTFKRGENRMINKERIWLSAAIVSLAFFYFNTEMHERYCHPVLFFLTAYAFHSRNYFGYIVFSIAYFLNLERVFSGATGSYFFNPDVLWYDIRTIAILYAIVMVYMFVKLYRLKDKETLVA